MERRRLVSLLVVAREALAGAVSATEVGGIARTPGSEGFGTLGTRTSEDTVHIFVSLARRLSSKVSSFWQLIWALQLLPKCSSPLNYAMFSSQWYFLLLGLRTH